MFGIILNDTQSVLNTYLVLLVDNCKTSWREQIEIIVFVALFILNPKANNVDIMYKQHYMN